MTFSDCSVHLLSWLRLAAKVVVFLRVRKCQIANPAVSAPDPSSIAAFNQLQGIGPRR
jgi:hypothetical protein